MEAENLHYPQPPASAAAKDVDMGVAVGALEHTRHEDAFNAQGSAAYGAGSLQFPVDAVHAAADVHQAVFAPGNGRKGQRFDQIAFCQHSRADGANLGITG